MLREGKYTGHGAKGVTEKRQHMHDDRGRRTEVLCATDNGRNMRLATRLGTPRDCHFKRKGANLVKSPRITRNPVCPPKRVSCTPEKKIPTHGIVVSSLTRH